VPLEPEQRYVESQRVRISYWDWGNQDAPPLVLVHGGGDNARSWQRVAEQLSDTYHVVAPDLRGHGGSDWVPGGTYGLPDNALDVVRVLEAVGAPARVLAHSYGGSVSLIAAGTYPGHFRGLMVLEGTHSLNPRNFDEMGPEWLRMWGDRVRGFEGSTPRVYTSVDEAADRLRDANPRLPADFLPSIAEWASKPVEGGYVWRHDYWINGRTSMEIRRAELPRFWAAVECPTLLVFADRDHTRSGQVPTAEEHFTGAQSVRTVFIPDSGHWIHHDQLARTVEEARTFFASV
jgi:pimeloyl-ACP methyl ester carboxylesterase